MKITNKNFSRTVFLLLGVIMFNTSKFDVVKHDDSVVMMDFQSYNQLVDNDSKIDESDCYIFNGHNSNQFTGFVKSYNIRSCYNRSHSLCLSSLALIRAPPSFNS